tara:strand:+ start:393 stop:599 length:207 start_codon:yes stop_codon:yes gene_type:complete
MGKFFQFARRHSLYLSPHAYIAIDPRLKDAGSIITIGFERDRAYLANALEIFLISKLQPVHNVVKVGM